MSVAWPRSSVHEPTSEDSSAARASESEETPGTSIRVRSTGRFRPRSAEARAVTAAPPPGPISARWGRSAPVRRSARWAIRAFSSPRPLAATSRYPGSVLWSVANAGTECSSGCGSRRGPARDLGMPRAGAAAPVPLRRGPAWAARPAPDEPGGRFPRPLLPPSGTQGSYSSSRWLLGQFFIGQGSPGIRPAPHSSQSYISLLPSGGGPLPAEAHAGRGAGPRSPPGAGRPAAGGKPGARRGGVSRRAARRGGAGAAGRRRGGAGGAAAGGAGAGAGAATAHPPERQARRGLGPAELGRPAAVVPLGPDGPGVPERRVVAARGRGEPVGGHGLPVAGVQTLHDHPAALVPGDGEQLG